MTAALRPLTAEDGPALVEVWEAASHGERARAAAAGAEGVVGEVTPERRERMLQGLVRFASTDPEGSWVAERGGRIVGFGLAIRRGGFWGLSMLFVHPDDQGRGLGRRLLDGCLSTAAGAEVAMIMSSEDPRAIRRYGGAGFALHPAVAFSGAVDRRAIPADLGGRRGDVHDLDIVTAVDLPLRGSSRAADLGRALEDGCDLVVVDDGPTRGWAAFREGRIVMLGATDARTAARTLWCALAETEGEVCAYCLTAEQQWAVEVALAARLTVRPCGPLFVRGLPRPPGPWLPSGWFF